MTIPAEALAEMEAWAQARKSNVLIVIHKGKVQLERYWNGTQPGELLNGRAITRSVTPMALGFAIADGKVGLDDPIGKYIHEWAGDVRGQIKVRHLAQNVSGLEVQAPLPYDQVKDNKDLCLVYCGDVVRAALAYEQTSEPGTKFEVAQENMQLLALVIERATGQPIQQLVSQRIWQPMGGSDATFQFDRPGGTARTMCCMRATARDWTRLGVLIANDGQWMGKQVLPQGWDDVMAMPSARNPNFGLGLWLGSPFVAMRTYFEDLPGVIPQSEPFVPDDVRIMEGGGFRIVHAVPSHELVIFRHGPLVDDWDTAFLVNTAIRGIFVEETE
ncbi:serine hydrolase domain-containing protein [Altererythrobacter sp. GH1-8]|uniref:serine hydrolase domain-containing protein n=1 Tax=Altererythrobacter sp. GH1-8 TaxID=3349333 RepID=UPI00374DE559